MFTGIIEEMGRVVAARKRPELAAFAIECHRVLDGASVGGSIAVNGVCVTVLEAEDGQFKFEAVPETLARRNLRLLEIGDSVNLERPLAVQSRFDGHIVQGHVDGLAEIAAVDPDGESLRYELETSPNIARYLVEKGFVALDGASLTITHSNGVRFGVALIPHTIANVVMGAKGPGYKVNVEVDVVAKYVEKLVGDPGTREFKKYSPD